MRFDDERTRVRIVRNSVLSFDHWYEGTPCWEWIGSKLGNANYGKFTYRNRKGRSVGTGAHRVSYTAFKGVRLGTRTVVRHMCNWSWCVNPAHLRRGTQAANNRDIVKSGRHGNGARKLIEEVVLGPMIEDEDSIAMALASVWEVVQLTALTIPDWLLHSQEEDHA